MSDIGIVIAAHGDLAPALLQSAELIVGESQNVATVSLDPTMNLKSMVMAMDGAIQSVDKGKGALVMLDLFGGTPCNATAICMQRHGSLAITGINLPMLLEVLMQRDGTETVGELLNLALKCGEEGIVDVKARLDLHSDTT